MVVCWNMTEKEELLRLLHDWRGACVLIATFGLTLIEDLTVGIIAGCVLAAAFAVFDRVRLGGPIPERCGWQQPEWISATSCLIAIGMSGSSGRTGEN